MSKEGKVLGSSTVTHEGSQIKLGRILCTACDTGDRADSYCRQCDEHLCAECTKYHRRQKKTKTHNIVSEPANHGNYNHCLEHENSFITKYCQTCDKLACSLCVEQLHRQCNIQNIEDCSKSVNELYLRENTEFQNLFRNMKTVRKNFNQAQTNFTSKCNKYEEDLRERRTQLVNIITLATDKAIDEVRAAYTEIGSMYTQSADELDNLLTKCDTVTTHFDGRTDVYTTAKQVLSITENIVDANNVLSKFELLDQRSVLSIGDDCVDLITEHINAYIKVHPAVIDSSQLKYKPKLVQVELKRGSNGLGFSFVGGTNWQHIPGDNGIYINTIVQGGAAYNDGRLREGDKLVSVNGINIENVTHSKAVSLIKAKDPIILMVQKRQPVCTKDWKVPLGKRHVSLRNITSDLGMNIVASEEADGVFISYICTGGVADKDGRLRKGDQIITVNGTDLENATCTKALATLNKNSPVVDITIIHRLAAFSQLLSKVTSMCSKTSLPTVKI